jgi:DNA-binding NarL/FixJ family response regulator
VVNEPPIRVVMADDHARMRTRIRGALEAGGCVVCGEGASANEAIALAVEHRPDVALLDIHMPGNGINAARDIARALPGTAVVMLTASAEDADLFDSLRAGASGYLLKDTDPAVLVDELRSALAGEAALSRRLVSRIMEEFRSPAIPRFSRRSRASARLSAREWEVMQLLGDGLSTDEVAQRLFLSPTTVRVHVSSVLRKLRVKDRESAFEVLRGD